MPIDAMAKTRLRVGSARPMPAGGGNGWPMVYLFLAATAALFGLADLVLDFGSNGAVFSWGAALAVIMASAALTFCRRQPVVILVLVLVARLIVAFAAGTEVALSIPGAVALYAVARAVTRRTAILAAIASAIVAAWAIVIVSPEALIEEGLAEIIIVLLVLAIAEVVRTNQARTNERIAAETAERVQAERLRIARDLHDVVAHSLSNIAVQSGVASRLIDTNPTHAKKALDIINDAGRSSLDELRSFLNLLRSEDDVLETGPTPDRTADIDNLIEQSAQAGIEVEVVRHGDFLPDTPQGVVLATYRIIQESLTNVARHAGPVAALIEFQHNKQGLHLRISNEPGSVGRTHVPSTGVGITGMTERAEAVGGELAARALPTGGFEVEAFLPYGLEDYKRP